MRNKKIIGMILFLTILWITNIVYAKEVVIALDPGHGGIMSGCANGNLVEKNLTLSISKYTKQYLDRYLGVKTILTHQGLPDNVELDLEERANIAQRNGADIMVSQHINDNADRSQYGAEVYVTTNRSKSQYNKGSTILGNKILKNISDLGIRNRGVLTREGTLDEWYPDGSRADYYAVIRHPIYRGFPGIIIEHGFIYHPIDIPYLDSEEDLEKLGRADAEAIADYYQLPYSADMNSQIVELSMTTVENKIPYMIGKIVIVEWFDGGISEVPKQLPVITLKSTDGTIKGEVFVSQVNGNTYYFDRNMDGLDTSKTYYLEVSSGERNQSAKKAKKIEIKNGKIGTYKHYQVMVENNTIKFNDLQYSADMNSQVIELVSTKTESGNYLIGKAVIVEWLNGKTSTVPKVMPKIILKSTDGIVEREAYVKQISGNTYYFDRNIDGLDISKTYYLEVTSGDKNNISTKKRMKMSYSKILGNYQGIKIEMKDKDITFEKTTYCADMNSQMIELVTTKTGNGNYLIGKAVIVEWLNGKTSTVPKVMPKIVLKSTDGTIGREAYVKQISGNTYYFDRNIDGLDISKTYYLELTSGDKNNISTKKRMKMTYSKILGNYQNMKIVMKDTNIIFETITYSANINSETVSITIGKTGNGNYLIGKVVIVEWLNGKVSIVPKALPKIVLKSTDGTIGREAYVKQISGNTYYFDRNIDGLDSNKTYYLEVSSKDKNNISMKKTIKMMYSDKKIGNYMNKKAIWKQNTISFE